MDSATILILAAIRPELAPTVRRLNLRWRSATRATGEVNGQPTLAAITGMGGERAVRVLDELLAEHPIEHVIHIGFAGGLSPTLRVGDVIEPMVFRHGRMQPPYLIMGPPNAHTLLTLDEPVLTPHDKGRWYDNGYPDAVNMETYHVQQRVAAAGVPYVALRAITDSYEDAIPPAALRWIDAYGRPRIVRVMLDLLRRPTLAHDLRRMQHAAQLAGNALADHVQRHLEQHTAPPRP